MPSDTARRVAFSTVAQIAGRILAALVSIVSLKLSTQYLGPTAYGNFVTATAFITLFSVLTDWGLNVVAVQEIAKDESTARTFIGINIAMRAALSLALVPLVALLGFLIYHDSNARVLQGVNLLLVTLVLTAVQNSLAVIFVVKTRNEITAAVDVAAKVAAVIAIVVVIHFDLGYIGYLVQSVIVVAFAAALTGVLARRYVAARPIFSASSWVPLFVRALPLGLVQIINTIYYKIDSVLLSVMRTPAEVGYYGISYRILDLVMAIPGFFMLALMPTLVRRGATPDLAPVVQKAFDVMVTLAFPLLVGSVLLSKQVVVAVSGPKFAAGSNAFAVLMVGGAVSYLNAVFGNTLVALGHQRALVPLTIVVVTLNIGLNLALIPPFGIVGAGVATSAAEFVALGYVATIFHRTLQVRVGLRQIPKTAGASAAMAGAWVLLHEFAVFSSPRPLPAAVMVTLLTLVFALALWALRGLPVRALRQLAIPT